MINHTNVAEITSFIIKLLEEINLLVDEHILPVKFKDISLYLDSGESFENDVKFTIYWEEDTKLIVVAHVYYYEDFNLAKMKQLVLESFVKALEEYFVCVFQFNFFNFGLKEKVAIENTLSEFKKEITTSNYRKKLREVVEKCLVYLVDNNVGA